MPTDKPAVSFRLSEDGKAMLAECAERQGVSQVAILEVLIRMLHAGHLTVVVPEDGRRPRRRGKSGKENP